MNFVVNVGDSGKPGELPVVPGISRVTLELVDPSGSLVPVAVTVEVGEAVTPPPPPPPAILNGGFEDPPMFAAITGIPPADWTFSGTRDGGMAYRSVAGSAFTSGNPPPAEGKVTLVLWKACEASQVVPFGADGQFVLAFKAAARGNHGDPNEFEVRVDGAPVGKFRPAEKAFADFSTPPFAVKAGDRKVAFVGLAPPGGDAAALVDDVRIQPSTPTGAQP